MEGTAKHLRDLRDHLIGACDAWPALNHKQRLNRLQRMVAMSSDALLAEIKEARSEADAPPRRPAER